MFKSGFVTIIGKPNVGKSTFLNTTIGHKIAIMSNKPQTTRNTISGVLNLSDAQIVFIDTPGIHKAKSELGKRMTDAAYNATSGVDAIILMITVNQHVSDLDTEIIESLKNTTRPIFLVINKIDLAKSANEIDKTILTFKDLLPFKGIFPISALENQNIDKLLEEIKEILPEGPKYYPDDMITDHPEKFIISEIIREKVLFYTRDEVPFSVAVVIDLIRKDENNPDLVECFATIYVERNSQKGILIGAGGNMLKRIGTDARKEIKQILGSKVYLELWVKVKEDWRNRSGALRALGYDIDNF